MSTGWMIGFVVGGAVTLVVVVLLALLIASTRAAAMKAEAILLALHAARDNTQGLWEIERTNVTTGRILAAAGRAREALARRAASPGDVRRPR